MIKFRGKWFNIEAFWPKLPNGKRIYFERMVRRNGVMIVPFLDKERVVMIKQHQSAVGKWVYQFPAGGVDNDENVKSTALRELKEETGYSAIKIKKIGSFYPDPGVIFAKIDVYIARDLKKGKQELDGREVIRTRTIKKSKIEGMARAGKIRDGRSLAAFYLALKTIA